MSTLFFPATQLFLAADPVRDSNCGTNNGSFLPGIYDGLCQNGQVVISGIFDFVKIGSNVVRILLALGGGLAVVGLIVAGIYYVTSSGDPKRISQAKSIIEQSLIGLFLLISAYAIVTYIASKF